MGKQHYVANHFFTACPVSALVCSKLKQVVGTVTDIFRLQSIVMNSSGLGPHWRMFYFCLSTLHTLTQLQNFMVFAKEETNIQASTMDLDVSPFVYDNQKPIPMGTQPSKL